jgi:hypothetical protein
MGYQLPHFRRKGPNVWLCVNGVLHDIMTTMHAQLLIGACIRRGDITTSEQSYLLQTIPLLGLPDIHDTESSALILGEEM